MFHPTTFGKYFLTRRIAVGGMAEVFAAKLYGADGFEKDLVIKQILPQYARDPEFVQSFVAEAKIAVSLTHANIVSIYELGRVDGTYFIAMEFVDGQDVFALLDAARRQDDPLDPGLALLIVEEVARGLDYAHRKMGPDGLPLGLVHRDLNPRNVLVAREGDVKILDFGIAKTASKTGAAMPKTRAGVVKGTTGYMSPEQATGNPIDLRTDLYQAGLLLHECLTGRALFWRPEDHVTRELMRRHEVIPPSQAVPNLPPEIDDLVLTALRVRPADRFQNAAELASAVARVRAIRYPAANHRALGVWVTRLIDRDRAASRAIEEEIPATADFSEVISQAIEQSIVGRVETIATRAPSGLIAMPRRPTTGSQPLDAHAITGDLVPASSTPAPVAPTAVLSGHPITGEFDPEGEMKGPGEDPGGVVQGPRRGRSVPLEAGVYQEAAFTPLEVEELSLGPAEDGTPHPQFHSESTLLSPRTRSNRMIWAVAGAFMLGALALTPFLFLGDASDPAQAQPEPGGEKSDLPKNRAVPLVETPKPEPAPSIAPGESPVGAEPRPAKSKTPAPKSREVPRPLGRSGSVDFGARPCPSRVTLDGRLLASPTPIFEKSVKPGRHRVVMVAQGCPLENAPKKLAPKQPHLSALIEVAPGRHLKVVADFDHKRIIVRDSER